MFARFNQFLLFNLFRVPDQFDPRVTTLVEFSTADGIYFATADGQYFGTRV